MSGITTTFTSTHDIDLHGCGESIAAATDNNPAENVKPFAFCSHVCGACVPVPLAVSFGGRSAGPWFETVKSAVDANEELLTEKSYFHCVTGANAKVEFVDPGQETIYLSESGHACELTKEETVLLEELRNLGEDAKEIWEGDEGNKEKASAYNEIMDRVNEILIDNDHSTTFKQAGAYAFATNGGFDFSGDDEIKNTLAFGFDHNNTNPGDSKPDLSTQEQILDMAYAHAVQQGDWDSMSGLINNLSETYGGIRNKYITAEYARLGFEIDEIIGSDGGVNWSLLGGVASSAVGDGIRNDLPPVTPTIDSLLPGAQGIPVDEDRRRLSEGNYIIYNNIMPHLYGFVEAYHEGGVDDFINNINNENSQGPLAGDFEQVDSQYLRDAFNNLMLAATETDPQAKQELVLLSTTQITLFEQSIPEVQKVLTDTFHDQPWFIDATNIGPLNIGGSALNNAISMTWDGFSISAGKDVPPPDPEAFLHNPNHINWKGIENPELWDLIEDIQIRGGSKGTEADDWHDLYERMYFISATLAQHGTHQGLYTMNQRLLIFDTLSPQKQSEIRDDQIDMLEHRIEQLEKARDEAPLGIYGSQGPVRTRLQKEIDNLEAEKEVWENMDIPNGLPKLAVISGATLTCPKAVMGSDIKFFNMKKALG